MANLPKPQLGDVTAITITTSDLEKSLQFYVQLGFRELYRFDFPYPFIQITDGALLIMLKKEELPSIVLTYYVKDVNKVVEGLENKDIQFHKKPREFDRIKHYSLLSPDQLEISLVDYIDGFYKPESPIMPAMNPEDYFNSDKYSNKSIGMFGELSHPVKDIETSILFWDKLGFKPISRHTSPYPWAILTDGLAVVGLHQTSDFKQPIITYFAGDMPQRIDNLKAAGLSGFNHAPGDGNMVLNTPENQKINLFELTN